MHPFTEEERQKADLIFEETIGKVSLGFDPDVLKILDDPESTEKEREEIKKKISQEICRTSHTAGKLGLSRENQYWKDSLICHGDFTAGNDLRKNFYHRLRPFGLSQGGASENPVGKKFFSRCCRKAPGRKDELAERICSTSGDLLPFLRRSAKSSSSLYENMQDETFTDGFYRTIPLLMALKIAEKFELPEYIGKSISSVFGDTSLNYTHDSLSTEGAVMMAYSTVNHIFARERCLVVRSPMPAATDIFAKTPGKAIYSYLSSLALSSGYLRIIPEESKPLE